MRGLAAMPDRKLLLLADVLDKLAARGNAQHEKRKGPGKPLEGYRALVQYAFYAEVVTANEPYQVRRGAGCGVCLTYISIASPFSAFTGSSRAPLGRESGARHVRDRTG